ncbi:MAG: hypothetical protein RLZ12_710 [Bacillota bacterium]
MQKKSVMAVALPMLLLICLTGFPQVSETIYTPALPDLGRGLLATANEMQFTLSIYFIGFAVGVYFWGRLSDGIGRRPSMLLGLVLYIVGSVGCLFSPTVGYLLVARFVQAFGASVGSVVTQAMLRESIPDEQKGVVFAKISAALAFTPAVGPLLGGWIDYFYGYTSIFLFLVLMGLVLLYFAFTKLPETRNQETVVRISAVSVAKQMVGDLRVWSFAGLIGVTNGIIFSFYGEAPFLFGEYFGFKPNFYGFIGIVLSSAFIVGAFLSKRLLRQKVAALLIIIYGTLIAMIGALLYTLLASAAQGPTKLLCLLLLGAIFTLFLGIGMIVPNALSLALLGYKQVLGTAGALLGLAYYFLVGFITSGMSYLHNGLLLTMPVYFLVLTVVMLGMAFLAKATFRSKI